MTKSIANLQRAAGSGQRADQSAPFDPLKVRRDFPILQTKVHGKPLIYLDNGATTQKPRAVIDATSKYYESQNANIHRGVYQLSQDATTAYETARQRIAKFLNATDPAEIIFTRGTTESINLVAHCLGRTILKPGDQVVVSRLEHHSNIVPWQMICEMTGAKLGVIELNDAGELQLDQFETLLGKRTKIVAISHVSNSLGTVNDVEKITRLAHAAGAKVLIDGAQWVAHAATDVQKIGCDFYAFSGHKLFGPTGIGVLWGKRELLESIPPYQGGGDMIESVTFEKTTYAPLPNKFEAGTPNIAGAVGLHAAIDYIESIGGFEAYADHEQSLLKYATQKLLEISGLRIIGTAKNKASVISFVMENPPISSLDLGMQLDRQGIAVRTGHHCCQPVMERFRIGSTTRASLAMYNTREDIDALVAGLREIVSHHQPAKKTSTSLEMKFASAVASSPEAAAEEIAELFEFLEERNAKNEQVIDYGNSLPRYFDVLKNLTQRVPGCMSQVYILTRRSPTAADRIEFIADADADIVRGEIAILQKLYSGQRAKDVLDFDMEAFFTRIGLEHFLTAQRRTGLASMVQRIRADAAEIVKRA